MSKKYYALKQVTEQEVMGHPVMTVSITATNRVRLEMSSVENPTHSEWWDLIPDDARRLGESLVKAARECAS